MNQRILIGSSLLILAPMITSGRLQAAEISALQSAAQTLGIQIAIIEATPATPDLSYLAVRLRSDPAVLTAGTETSPAVAAFAAQSECAPPRSGPALPSEWNARSGPQEPPNSGRQSQIPKIRHGFLMGARGPGI